MNAVWPVRDKGWNEVFEALRNSASAKKCLESWFPPEVGIVEKIDELMKKYPEGFKMVQK